MLKVYTFEHNVVFFNITLALLGRLNYSIKQRKLQKQTYNQKKQKAPYVVTDRYTMFHHNNRDYHYICSGFFVVELCILFIGF